jgi:hypothetical protein
MLPTAYKDGKLYSIRPTDGSGDFTFSRGSNLAATRVDVNGLIEKGRENLLLQSNTFDTTWTLSTAAISVSGGQNGYDGSNDAWLLERSDASSRYITQGFTSSGVNTFSVYAKPDSVGWMYVYVGGGGVSRTAYFDITNGALGSTSNVITTSIEAAGNGYYRCSIVVDATITTIRLYPAVANGSVTGGVSPAGIYIQDAQLEQGLVATDYIETGASTAQAGILEDLPRLDYSGGASCPSLLLEPQRSNLVDDYSGYTWDSFNGAAISFTGTERSPEGFVNAVTWTFGGSSGEVVQRSSISISNSTTYTISGYFKLTSGTLTSGSNQIKGLDGLSGGSVSLNTLTDEWQRLTFSVTSSSTSGRVQLRCDNSATIQVYGLQLESGIYETSVIPTYGSAVTRSKDSFNMNLQSQSIYDASDTQGVLMVEYEKPNSSENVDLMRLMGASAVGRAFIYNSGVNFASDWAGGVSGVIDHDSNNKTIWRLNSLSSGNMFHNGTKLGGEATGTAWSDIRLLRFNMEGTGGVLRIKQILLFPTALTDSECIALTTI